MRRTVIAFLAMPFLLFPLYVGIVLGLGSEPFS